MSTIESTQSIPLSQATLLKRPPLIQPSEEFMARMESARKTMYMRPVGPPDNAPQNLYAKVYDKDGKAISEISNSGGASMPNALGGLIMSNPELRDGPAGPQLAQKRAEAIAEAVGGTIVKAPTAQTQAEWEARPRREIFFDETAYERDLARNQAYAQQRHEGALAALPQLKMIAQEMGWDWQELAGPLLAESKAKQTAA